MKTKLERLLDQIDPSKTLDKVASRVDRAVNRYSIAYGTIKDMESFERILSEFFRHIEKEVLKVPKYPPFSSFDWGRCSVLLEKQFGRRGHIVAFEMARTGTQGGLYEVLKKIASNLGNKYAQNEISSRVGLFWNGLSLNEKFAVIDEYAKKFGRFLPKSYLESNAVFLKMNFTKVLEEHPRMVQRFRGAGRF